MAMRHHLRRLSSVAVLGTLAALLSVSSPAQASQPVQTGPAESTTAVSPLHAPIVGIWRGDLVGTKLTFEVFRIGPTKYRALAIDPLPGCEFFRATGSGLHYDGRVAPAECDGSGSAFEMDITISRNRNQMTISPPPGEPGDSLVFYRIG